ncbi:MAG: T9SS type A sorting domain-containing protein, partial [Candidatus Kapabacteria bacterium]|nr:T9SS type A sorting domain-containing protein [Candidatus Kapabacteria bacterium]
YLNGTGVQIENCIIAFNENKHEGMPFAGGGISCSTAMDSRATIKNCLIYGNKAAYGAGVRLAGNVTLINCVIANNIATEKGSGLYYNVSDAEVINCVIANNHTLDKSGNIVPGYQIAASQKHNFSLRNSIVYQKDGLFWDESTSPNGFGKYLRTNFNRDSTDAYGNLFSDPRFENIDANLFKLLPGSPAIDAGLNIDDLPDSDYFNLVRLWDGNDDNISIVDIGIHEFGAPEIQNIYKVKETGFESETDFVRYDSDSYQRTEEESRSGDFALLLLNSDDDSEKWLTSERFETDSDEKYYLSFWVKISGMPLEEEDVLSISFSPQGAEITSEEYIIHTINKIDRLWQKVMIEISVQPSDDAIFAVSAMINSGSKLYIDDIMIEKESGLSSVEIPDKLIQIKLCPNPANDYLKISFPDEILYQTSTFEIFNSNGIMVKSIKRGTKIVNISDFSSGMYFLRISFNGSAFYRKFAVVR